MEIINFTEMTTVEIIGNILGLIAMAIMVFAGTLKVRQQILVAQIIQLSVLAVGTFMLGGISGGISIIITLIAIIMCYMDFMTLPVKVILSVLTVGVPLAFGNMDLFFFLPTVANIVYIWLLQTKDVIKLKLIIVVISSCWLAYELLYIHMYTSAIVRAVSIIVMLISTGKLYYIKRRKECSTYVSN